MGPDDRCGSVTTDQGWLLNDCFQGCQAIETYVLSAVVWSEPPGASIGQIDPGRRCGKTSGPEWPPGAFSAGRVATPMDCPLRAQYVGVGGISRHNRLGGTICVIFGFRSAKNAPSDCFRSTKLYYARISTKKVRNRFGLQTAPLEQAENLFGFFRLETINLSVSGSVNH